MISTKHSNGHMIINPGPDEDSEDSIATNDASKDNLQVSSRPYNLTHVHFIHFCNFYECSEFGSFKACAGFRKIFVCKMKEGSSTITVGLVLRLARPEYGESFCISAGGVARSLAGSSPDGPRKICSAARSNLRQGMNKAVEFLHSWSAIVNQRGY